MSVDFSLLVTRLDLAATHLAAALREARGESGSIATFTVAAVNDGWYSTLMAAPQGAAIDGFAFGNLPTQVDVRRRHPDGSIWQAQVTCKPEAPGPLIVRNAPGVTGTFTPRIPTVVLTADITAGEVTGPYTTALPTVLIPGWLNGPLCQEGRAVVRLLNAAGIPHPTACVVFDCRVFNDGKAKVGVGFWNIKDSGTGKKLVGAFTVTINGVARLVAAPATVLLYGWWHREFCVDLMSPSSAWTEADVAPDWTPYMASGLLATYDLTMPPNIDFAADYSATPLDDACAIQDFWGEAGKRWELGYGITATAIAYLAHKTAGGKAHAKLIAQQLGRWYGAVSMTDGIEPVDCLDQYPNYWSSSVFNANPALGLGPRNCNMTECSRDGKTYHNWENAHRMSPLLVAYLATGDRIFYDVQRLYAVDAILQTTPKATPTGITRRFAQGGGAGNFDWAQYAGNGGKDSRYFGKQGMVCVPPSEGNQVRGMGRALTQLVHASAITTDAQVGTWTKQRFGEVVETNLDWLDLRARVDIESGWNGPNPLKVPFAWMVGLSGNNDYNQSLSWTGTYLLFAIQIGIDTGHAKGVYARDAILNSLLIPMRAAPAVWKGGKRFCIGYGGPIWMCSYKNAATPNRMLTLAEAWAISVGGEGTDVQLVQWPDPTKGGYGEEQRAMAALAEALGHPDGKALLAWCDAFVGPEGGTIASQLQSVTRAGHNWFGTAKVA